jgi:hypothetical protein
MHPLSFASMRITTSLMADAASRWVQCFDSKNQERARTNEHKELITNAAPK